MNALDQNGRWGRPSPQTWYGPQMFAAVMARDFTRVYQLLQKRGFSQQRIAALTGQSQPEVSAIVHGRKIMAYDVMLRIVDGLGSPRGMAGLCFCSCRTLDHMLTVESGPPEGVPSCGRAVSDVAADGIAEAS